MKTILIITAILFSQFSLAMPNIDTSSYKDVRLYKINCNASWKFDKYIKCLDNNGLIPGVRASYFSRRTIKRFYNNAIKEGDEICRETPPKIKVKHATCINRYVFHKAQMIGSTKAEFNSLTPIQIGSRSITD